MEFQSAQDAAGVQLQAARLLPVMCRQARGADGGASRRTGHPLGGHPPVGRLGADSLALLDDRIERADDNGAYHHAQNHQPILHQ